jgi:hypothetical protein
MAVELWEDGPNGPERVMIDPEVFNMSFLEHGYRFTKEKEKELETDEDTKEEPNGTEERETDADKYEEPVKEEMLKRPYNKRR